MSVGMTVTPALAEEATPEAAAPAETVAVNAPTFYANSHDVKAVVMNIGAAQDSVNVTWYGSTPTGGMLKYGVQGGEMTTLQAAVAPTSSEGWYKNTVTLTVPVGSDLIASQGWVRTDETTYKYVVTTKANETSVLDNNADIIISGVKVTVYGVSAPALNVSYVKDVNGVTNYTYVTSFDELASFSAKEPGDNFCPMNAKSEDHILAMCFDYGRKADEADAVFGAGGLNVTNMDKTGKILYTVKAATVDGQYITSGSWNQSVTEDNGGKVTVSVPLKAGDKIYFGTVNYTTLSPAAQKALNDNLTKAGASIKASYGYGAEQVIINRPAEITVDGMAKGYNAYMVREDGSLQSLSAKFNEGTGLLSFGGTLTGPVIVTDKALTATTTSNSGNSGSNGSNSNGGSQNPATGANDIVGVAAALVVITGVSAAAISLKKD